MYRFVKLSLALFLSTTALTVQSADQILQKTIQASGGAAKLRAARSRLLVGQARLAGGAVSGEFRWLSQRPNQLKIEIMVGDQAIIQAYDGQSAWILQPIQFGGSGAAEVLDGPAGDSVAKSATFESVILDYQRKGHRAELLAPGEVRGQPAFRIKLHLADGTSNEHFIDQQSYLPIKIVSSRFNPQSGTEVPVEQFISDYRMIDGVPIAHKLETLIGGQVASEFSISSVQLDVDAKAIDFQLPSR